MKKLPLIALVLLLSAPSAFGEISELTLTNGKVFKNVSVVRYEAANVVLKSASGTGAVSYDMIPEPYRADMLKRRDVYVAGEKSVSKKEIIEGMTETQVVRSWGEPTRKSQYGGKRESTQWVYANSNARTVYVYFEKGAVTSWSDHAH